MNASPTWGYTRGRGELKSLGHDLEKESDDHEA